MSNLVENNDWDINRCSKPFCCKEDAEEYMQAKNFEGMVLELNDGSIQAVCPTYPEGFYPEAKVLSTMGNSESCCEINE